MFCSKHGRVSSVCYDGIALTCRSIAAQRRSIHATAAVLGVDDPDSRGGGDVGRQASAADDVLWRREGEGSWKGMVSDGLLWMHSPDSAHGSHSERL